MLEYTCTERHFDEFFGYLAENIKNTAVRLGKQGTMDKKVERAIKQSLLERFTTPLTEFCTSKNEEGLPEIAGKELTGGLRMAVSRVMNLLAVEDGSYLGLEPSED